MPCNALNLGNGVSAIICTRGSRRCGYCSGLSEFQCDFPIGKYKSGKKKGENRTCDKHLCRDHVRHGVTKGVDFCPEHYPIAKAAYEKRVKTK